MSTHQTKHFNRREVSFPLLLILGGLSIFMFLYASSFLSLTLASNTAGIEETDRVTVDGVSNTAQYLTSMVLHAPGSNKTVTLNYDPDLNALRIKGAVNADGLVVGKNKARAGNTVIWGSNNKADDTKNTNSLIVGWDENSIAASSNSAVIGGGQNRVNNSENVALIGSLGTKLIDTGKKENIFIVGGRENQIKGSNIFIMGWGQNTVGSDTILMGKNIKAWEKEQIFVWSDSNQEFIPKRSNAFYVNPQKGLGLNTTTPQVKFDIGKAGGVKVSTISSSLWVCNDEFKGVMAYVQTGGIASFCGCNGKFWLPLADDLKTQIVCDNLQKRGCTGTLPQNAQKGPDQSFSIWDSNAHNGNGAFVGKPWIYSTQIPTSDFGILEKDFSTWWEKSPCTYECMVWFHPGQNNPEGKHLDGACKSCTSFDKRYTWGANNWWKSAGTWDNNCDFWCVAGSKYVSTSNQRACSTCEIGTWTADKNQDISCKNCQQPAKLYVDKLGKDPHFSKFTSFGTSATSCDFECSPRYAHFYNGKNTSNGQVSIVNGQILPQGNACIHCPIGTWSKGGKNKTCARCTNKPESLAYQVDNKSFSLSSFTTYTSNGSSNTPQTDCEWTCDTSLGLRKIGNTCTCESWFHLEGGRCIANTKRINCWGNYPTDRNAVRGASSHVISGWWSFPTWRWNAVPVWSYTSSQNPWVCQWTCKAGYKYSNGRCIQEPKCKTTFSEPFYWARPSVSNYPFDPTNLVIDQEKNGGTAWANFKIGSVKNCTKTAWETSGPCFDRSNFSFEPTHQLNSKYCDIGQVDQNSLFNAYASLRYGPKTEVRYTCRNNGLEISCPIKVSNSDTMEIRGWVNGNGDSKQAGFYVTCKKWYTNNYVNPDTGNYEESTPSIWTCIKQDELVCGTSIKGKDNKCVVDSYGDGNKISTFLFNVKDQKKYIPYKPSSHLITNYVMHGSPYGHTLLTSPCQPWHWIEYTLSLQWNELCKKWYPYDSFWRRIDKNQEMKIIRSISTSSTTFNWSCRDDSGVYKINCKIWKETIAE